MIKCLQKNNAKEINASLQYRCNFLKYGPVQSVWADYSNYSPAQIKP